jgi:hypothetical protein
MKGRTYIIFMSFFVFSSERVEGHWFVETD